MAHVRRVCPLEQFLESSVRLLSCTSHASHDYVGVIYVTLRIPEDSRMICKSMDVPFLETLDISYRHLELPCNVLVQPRLGCIQNGTFKLCSLQPHELLRESS